MFLNKKVLNFGSMKTTKYLCGARGRQRQSCPISEVSKDNCLGCVFLRASSEEIPAFEQYTGSLAHDIERKVGSYADNFEEAPDGDYFQLKQHLVVVPASETVLAEDLHARTMWAFSEAIEAHRLSIIKAKAGVIQLEDIERRVVPTPEGLEDRAYYKGDLIVAFLPIEIKATFGENDYKAEFIQKHRI